MKKIILSLVLLLVGNVTVNAQANVVESYSGNGGKNTRPFTVSDGWEIQWDASGDIFQLYLYSKDGDMLGVPANQQGSGKGSSYQANAGTYYLQVNAIGGWDIKIVQVNSGANRNSTSQNSPNNSQSYIAKFSGNGGKNTRPFSPSGSWEIKWDASGDIFQLYLYSKDGDLIGVPANQQGSGKGSSYQPKGGNYYLQVNAIGKWKIEILPAN